MNIAPRVTVLMSAYNAMPYIVGAVDSVLGQSFPDFEFLIFDDASTDGTREALRRYSDPRVHIVENPDNRGLTRNLVTGMELARGQYVARLDADDYCMAERLARQVAYLDANPDIGMVGCAVTFVGEGREPFLCMQPTSHEEIKCELLFSYTMLHSSVMMRKAAFDVNGLNYDPAFPVSQDHDLWVRASRHMQFANIPDPLVCMREHEGKVGRRFGARQREYSDIVRRRQLAELGLELSDAEFHAFATGDEQASSSSIDTCRLIDEVYMRVMDANRTMRVFDQEALERAGARRFQGLCRHMLLAGNVAGRYFWNSRMKRLAKPSVRERIGLRARSILLRFGWTAGLAC